MPQARVAINGLGRIGRAALKIALETPELDVVAANDVAAQEAIVYLLRHDTVYGRWEREVTAQGDRLVVGGREVRLTRERDPLRLPWGELNVDVVLECTGAFTSREELAKRPRPIATEACSASPTSRSSRPTSCVTREPPSWTSG